LLAHSTVVIPNVPAAMRVLLADVDDPFLNQITLYPVATKDGRPAAVTRFVFKIFPATQSVVFWTPGTDDVPQSFSKCAVRDRLHWRCEIVGSSSVAAMDNGSLTGFPVNADSALPGLRYVRRWEWLAAE
jgi:hypothetical protein